MDGTYRILLKRDGYTVNWHEESGLFAVGDKQIGDEFPAILTHKDTFSEALAWLDGFLYRAEP